MKKNLMSLLIKKPNFKIWISSQNLTQLQKLKLVLK